MTHSDNAMSRQDQNAPHPPQSHRPIDEARALARCVTPMSEDTPARTVEKLIALILVVAWTAATLAMTFSAVQTTVPPYWMAFTALVFLLVGRLWNLEVDKLLPIDTGGGDNNDGGGSA